MKDTWIIEGKYEVISKIKQGGFGIVYYGFDRKFEKPIAIKAIEPSLLKEAKYIDLFLVEAKNAAKLNHNNIVHVYDLIKTDDGQFYIIMEYIDGVDMRRIINKCKAKNVKMPIELSLYLMKEICKALEYAHNKTDLITKEPLNLVHQDISPSNIMVSIEGNVKLIDFGIATIKFRNNNDPHNIILAGKLPYMAPDQLNGSIVDKRTDLFSLGSVFFEILTNKMLFYDDDDEKIIELIKKKRIEHKYLSQYEIPEQIQNILIKALQKDTEDRYQGAKAIYIDLAEYLMDSTQSVELSIRLGNFIQEIFQDELTKSMDTQQTVEIDLLEKDEKIQELTQEETETVIPEDLPVLPAVDTIQHDIENINDSPVPGLQKQQQETTESFAEEVQLSKLESHDNDNIQQSADNINISQEDTENSTSPYSNEVNLDEIQTAELEHELAKFERTQQIPSEEKPKKDDSSIGDLKRNKFTPAVAASFDDEEHGEDEIKTVIDVIRLSAKTHKKPLILSLIGILATFIIFMILNITFRWTAFGEQVYDFLFPPAIKISSVPQGAKVYIDNDLIPGKTPLTIAKITPGVHTLKLTFPGFSPMMKSLQVPSKGDVKVAGEDTRKSSKPYLFRFKTQIELNSDPISATIYINNIKHKQQTPTTIEWEVGIPLNLEMSKPGFEELTGFSLNTIDESADIEDHRLWNFNIIEESGNKKFLVEGLFKKFVSISSLPTGVTFYLDGSPTPTGKTGSAQAIALSVGKHDILFTKAGFNSKRIPVTVDAEGPKSIFVSLTRNVRFFAKDISSPNDNDIGATISRIYRQGKSYSRDDKTPCEIALPLVNHKVLVKKDGYKDAVVLVSASSKVIVARMEPQNSSIEVTVTDALSGQPIAEAQISYVNSKNNTENEIFFGTSNALGKCKNNLEPGQYTFTVKKLGYFEKSANLNTLSGQKNLNVKLIIQ